MTRRRQGNGQEQESQREDTGKQARRLLKSIRIQSKAQQGQRRGNSDIKIIATSMKTRGEENREIIVRARSQRADVCSGLRLSQPSVTSWPAITSAAPAAVVAHGPRSSSASAAHGAAASLQNRLCCPACRHHQHQHQHRRHHGHRRCRFRRRRSTWASLARAAPP
eukprot:1485037-Pleurochrysis_carterae.AAC.1